MRKPEAKLNPLIKVVKFFKEYRQLALVIISVLVALGLDIAGFDTAAHWILGLSAIGNVIPLVWGMYQDLRTGTYGVDILAATAIITAVIMDEYWAAIVIVLMLTGGEALEDYAQRRARSELSALMDRAPKKAHIIRGRKVLDVKVSDVRPKDKLIIKPGELVPVDAEIIEGNANVDESSLTGESLPVTKSPGDLLLSGSINLDGALTVKALRAAKDSQYQQIVRLVRSAASTKSPFVRLADRYSIPFTLTAFIIAGGAWAASGDSLRFLQVLVVATPCPLIFGAPVAIISGISRAAKHGIIIKSGRAIEQLADVRTIGFDKTGTLTRGAPVVVQVKTFGGHTKDEVLSLAAGLEQSSTHVLATAIVEAARKSGAKIIKAKHVSEHAGKGLSAQSAGKQVLVGRLAFLKEQEVTLPSTFNPKDIEGMTTYVAISGKLAGAIMLKDEVRPESKKTLSALRKLGIKHILMVTGDNKNTAREVALGLGIDNVYSESLPAEKLHTIEGIKERPVAFVGDGVNDAPVLAAADVGVALGARGSTAASESADVVIMLDDVRRVAVSVGIAKRTLFIAKQSILVGIFISVGLMLVYSTGKFSPVSGAFIQEIVDVIVIFNALRAHGPFRGKDPLLLTD